MDLEYVSCQDRRRGQLNQESPRSRDKERFLRKKNCLLGSSPLMLNYVTKDIQCLPIRPYYCQPNNYNGSDLASFTGRAMILFFFQGQDHRYLLLRESERKYTRKRSSVGDLKRFFATFFSHLRFHLCMHVRRDPLHFYTLILENVRYLKLDHIGAQTRNIQNQSRETQLLARDVSHRVWPSMQFHFAGKCFPWEHPMFQHRIPMKEREKKKNSGLYFPHSHSKNTHTHLSFSVSCRFLEIGPWWSSHRRRNKCQNILFSVTGSLLLLLSQLSFVRSSLAYPVVRPSSNGMEACFFDSFVFKSRRIGLVWSGLADSQAGRQAGRSVVERRRLVRLGQSHSATQKNKKQNKTVRGKCLGEGQQEKQTGRQAGNYLRTK